MKHDNDLMSRKPNDYDVIDMPASIIKPIEEQSKLWKEALFLPANYEAKIPKDNLQSMHTSV
ncbi:MAG: hypothetical protein RIG62_14900 [Cyclobacteriaceae bacterium]